LDNQKTAVPGPVNQPRGVTKNVQYSLDADGASSVTLQFEGTNNLIDWIPLGSAVTITTAGAGHSGSGVLDTNAWGFVRVNVTAISGTNARVNAHMVAI
jgi:hypothetical protein